MNWAAVRRKKVRSTNRKMGPEDLEELYLDWTYFEAHTTTEGSGLYVTTKYAQQIKYPKNDDVKTRRSGYDIQPEEQ